jgi:excisionase family DNA binding protein
MSDRTDLQARLDAGDWLTAGEAAILLGAGRTTIHRLLTDGVLAYRVRTGTGGYREIDPESLRTELARREAVHRGTAEDPAPGDAGSGGQ